MGGASSIPSHKPDQRLEIIKKSFTTVVDTSSSFRLSMLDMSFPDQQWKSKICPKSPENRMLIMKALRKKYIFKSFSEKELNDIIDVFQPVSCDIGREIIKAGHNGKHLYIIDEGVFEERSIKSSSRRKYAEDEMFGHLSLLYNNLSKSVTCLQTAKLWSLSRENFRYYLVSHSYRMTRIKYDMFDTVSFLKDLNSRERCRLAEVAMVMEYEKDDVIENDHIDFHILIKGRVKSSQDIPFAEDKLMLKSGDCFDQHGWIPSSHATLVRPRSQSSTAILNQLSSPRTANGQPKQQFVADTNCMCLKFNYLQFDKAVGKLEHLFDRSSKKSLLNETDFMKKIPSDKRKLALELFVTKTFQNGEVITQCGDPNAQFVVIRSGEAFVWHHPAIHATPHLYQTKNSLSMSVPGQHGSSLKKHDKNVFLTSTLGSEGFSSTERSASLTEVSHHITGSTKGQLEGNVVKLPSLKKDPGSSVRLVRENCVDVSSMRLSVGDVNDYQKHELPSSSREEEMMTTVKQAKPQKKKNSKMRPRSFSVATPLGVHIDDSEPLDAPPTLVTSKSLSSNKLTKVGGVGSYKEPTGAPPTVSSTSTIKVDSIAVTQAIFPDLLDKEIEDDEKAVNGSQEDDASYNASEEEERAEERDGVKPLQFSSSSSAQVSSPPKSSKDSACFEVVIQLLNSARSSCSSSQNSSVSSDSEDSFGSQTNEKKLKKSLKMNTDEKNVVPKSILSNKTKHQTNSVADLSEYFPNPKTKDFLRNLEAFQMKSYFSSFVHSVQGKKEFFWRKSIIFMKDEYESMNISKIRADMTMNNKNHLSDLFADSNTDVIKDGEHVGTQAVFNGTTMDTTMIAKGQVTCYVLSRSSYNELIRENIDANFYDTDQSDDVNWSNLTNTGLVGEGTFGSVYLMENSQDQKKYALKVFNKSKISTSFYAHRIESEISLLAKLKTRHVSKLIKSGDNLLAYYILMEYVSGGNLRSVIHPTSDSFDFSLRFEKMQGISHQSAKFYIAAMSLPILHLHRRGIAYRDLKPENVMIDRHGYPKLVDFGLSKQFNFGAALMKGVDIGKTYTLCGTPEYMAPEVVLGRGHNHAVDWWSLGIVLYEMVVGATPFGENNEVKSEDNHSIVFENIVNNRPYFPIDMEDGCKALIQSLLVSNPSLRLNCTGSGDVELQEHDWFHGIIDWYALNVKQMTPPWFPHSV